MYYKIIEKPNLVIRKTTSSKTYSLIKHRPQTISHRNNKKRCKLLLQKTNKRKKFPALMKSHNIKYALITFYAFQSLYHKKR